MRCFSGREYLQMDIASSFGLDKMDWDVRLDWFEENRDRLLERLHEAEEPAMFYAGVKAWADVEAGRPSGYPISLDATASGMQWLTCLTGDRKAAEICNVVAKHISEGGDHREDAYTSVYAAMLAVVNEDGTLLRDDVKSAVMKAFFGSKAVPKQVFGEGPLLDVFEATMERLAPGPWELNKAFLDMWDPKVLCHSWILPDNFHVHIKVMDTQTQVVNFLSENFDCPRKVNAPIKEGRSLAANTIHSIDGFVVREMTRRCDYDPQWIELIREILSGESEFRFATLEESQEAHRMVGVLSQLHKESGYLSARILDYIDSDTLKLVDVNDIKVLLGSLPKKPFKFMVIFDCFRCLPNYGNDLRWQYNNQLSLIAESNMLAFILNKILGFMPVINKLDPELHNDVINTDYALA